MSVTISKPIDRAYLVKNLEKFAGHELYEKISIAESYTKVDSTTTGALLVVDDSVVTPGTGEVGISVVQPFISDIAVGDYVTHTEAHEEVVSKFAPRDADAMSDEEIGDLFDVTGEEAEAYKSIIKDDTISTVSTWSSYKINDVVKDITSSGTIISDESDNAIILKTDGLYVAQQTSYVSSEPMTASEGSIWIS